MSLLQGRDAESGGEKIMADTTATKLPTTPEQLLARLAALGIHSTTVRHAPVFTVEEAKALRGELPGTHIKNLFLRSKKGEMVLVTCLEDRRVDLKSLAERLGTGRFSFGNAERLMTYLGVTPGSVTPFAVINDRDRAVRVVLDKAILAGGPIHCHPLVNDMATAIAPDGLLCFLEAEGHSPRIIDLDAP
jgi:Ala-tRNA(Pro) deacylase